VIVRPAKTSDASGIAAVHVSGWQAAYRHLLPAAYLDALDPAEREVRWSRRLPCGVLVAEVDGQVAGFASTGRCRDEDLPDSTELYALYLAPDWWRQGRGSALLEAVVVPGLVLWTLAGNGGPARSTSAAASAPTGLPRPSARAATTWWNCATSSVRFPGMELGLVGRTFIRDRWVARTRRRNRGGPGGRGCTGRAVRVR